MPSDPRSTEPIRFRLPTETLQRADVLAERLATDPTVSGLVGGRPNRMDVLRLAIARGMALLEKEQGITPPS